MKLGLMSCPDDLYDDILLNSVLVAFEDDYHLRKRISASNYNA